MVKNFLIVQGRLLSQENNQLQSFPMKWRDEFPLIQDLGFNGIEWIYDKFSEKTNPIITKQGQKEIINLSKKYNVKLSNIVFDWFIEFPLYVDGVIESSRYEKLEYLINLSSKIGFKRIIFPILESNSLNTSFIKNDFIKLCKEKISGLLDKNDIEFHLETSMTPEEELNLLSSINHPKFFICFDMGNSASLGFEPVDTLNKIKKFLGSVHIKDRKLHGFTVPLGTGNVNFFHIFSTLQTLNFVGPISFQCFRDSSSDNISLIKKYSKFINDIISEIEDDKKNC